MIAGKKLIIGLLCFSSLGVFSQQRGDLGVIGSTDFLSRIGLEYRTPLGEKYKWKLGFTGGSDWDFAPREQIVSATDTTVIMSRYTTASNQVALRFGLERQLKASVFSIGLDLNMGYLNKRYNHRNFAEGLNEDGQWVFAEIVSEEEYDPNNTYVTPGFDRPIAIGDYGFAEIKRHFISTNLRLSINMNVPLGESFLIHASFSETLGIPIYMGASDINDANNIYLGTPPSILNLNTNVNVGLRYLIGSRKK